MRLKVLKMVDDEMDLKFEWWKLGFDQVLLKMKLGVNQVLLKMKLDVDQVFLFL